MVMQGMCNEQYVLDFDDIATAEDWALYGGRFACITLAGTLAESNVISLACGGKDPDLLPSEANVTVTLTLTTAGSGKVAASKIDLGGYTLVKITGVTGMTAGKIYFEPSWS